MKEHLWKLIGIIAVLAIGGSIVYSNSVQNAANEGVTFTAHIKGNENASVTLTEYSDFQCPACAQFAEVVHEVMAAHPDDLKLEYKHYPLISIHRYAMPAAKAAEAAGQQGKFFEMHDLLFENQQVWSNSSNPSTYFIGYAESLGLDVGLFKTHMAASKIEDKITDEFKEARELGLSGTPTFFLNGVRMEFDTYQSFVDQINVAITGEATPTEDATSTQPDVTFGL